MATRTYLRRLLVVVIVLTLPVVPRVVRALTCSSFSPQAGFCKPPSSLDPWYNEYIDLVNDLDALFHATTGHDHSGTTGKGPFVVVRPKTAPDCTVTITTAVQHELCIDTDDYQMHFCANPTAAGTSTVCDNAADWVDVVSTTPIPTWQQVMNASVVNDFVDLNSSGFGVRVYGVDTVAEAWQFCRDSGFDECWKKWNNPVTGDKTDVIPPSDTIMTLANNQNFILENNEGTDLLTTSESTGVIDVAAAGVPSDWGRSALAFRTDDLAGTNDDCYMGPYGAATGCASNDVLNTNASIHLVPAAGTIASLWCQMGTVPAGTTYVMTVRKNAVNQSMTVTLSATNTPQVTTSNAFTVVRGDRISILQNEGGTGGDGGISSCTVEIVA